jgi:hypothetical protein
MKKPTDSVVFEARVFVDGRIAGYEISVSVFTIGENAHHLSAGRNGLGSMGHGQRYWI